MHFELENISINFLCDVITAGLTSQWAYAICLCVAPFSICDAS